MSEISDQIPPDDKGYFTKVVDKKTGKTTYAEILTPEEVQKEFKNTPPNEMPIAANPPRPGSN